MEFVNQKFLHGASYTLHHFSMLKKVRVRIKEISAAFTLLSVELIILLAIFGGALVIFIGVAEMVFKDNKSDFDPRLLKFYLVR